MEKHENSPGSQVLFRVQIPIDKVSRQSNLQTEALQDVAESIIHNDHHALISELVYGLMQILKRSYGWPGREKVSGSEDADRVELDYFNVVGSLENGQLQLHVQPSFDLNSREKLNLNLSIKSSLRQFKNGFVAGQTMFLHDSTEAKDVHTALIGVFNLLDGLALPLDCLQLDRVANPTILGIRLPLTRMQEIPQPAARSTFEICSIAHEQETLKQIARNCTMDLVVFDQNFKVLRITDGLLKRHHIAPENPAEVVQLFQNFNPGKLFVFDFLATGYNVYLKSSADLNRHLYFVVGYREADGHFLTVWHWIGEMSNAALLMEGPVVHDIKIRELLEPYLPPEAMQRASMAILRGQSDQALQDELINASVLFADLVDFTRIAESMDPDEVVSMLNIAMGMCARNIQGHKGEVDKFMGDGLMAVFREPARAVISAMEILHHFAQMNKFRTLQDLDPLRIRIGIQTGRAIHGSIGTESRKDLTLIGDTVNTAARIEKAALPGSVFIGESTYSLLANQVECDYPIFFQAKGKREQVKAYQVKRIRFARGKRRFELKAAAQ